MHGVCTIVFDMLDIRHTDPSCHHEVWVHLSHVNARVVDRVSRNDRSRRLHVKEKHSRRTTTAKKEAGPTEKATIRLCYRSSV